MTSWSAWGRRAPPARWAPAGGRGTRGSRAAPRRPRSPPRPSNAAVPVVRILRSPRRPPVDDGNGTRAARARTVTLPPGMDPPARPRATESILEALTSLSDPRVDVDDRSAGMTLLDPFDQ